MLDAEVAGILAKAGWGCGAFSSWTVLAPPPGLALRSNRRLSRHRKASLPRTPRDYRPALSKSANGGVRRSPFWHLRRLCFFRGWARPRYGRLNFRGAKLRVRFSVRTTTSRPTFTARVAKTTLLAP